MENKILWIQWIVFSELSQHSCALSLHLLGLSLFVSHLHCKKFAVHQEQVFSTLVQREDSVLVSGSGLGSVPLSTCLLQTERAWR